MDKLTLLLISLTLGPVLYAQSFDLSQQTDGRVVTASKDTLHGRISLAPDRKSLMLQTDGGLRHFPATRVKEVFLAEMHYTVAVHPEDLEPRLMRLLVRGAPSLAVAQVSGEYAYFLIENGKASPLEANEKALFESFGKWKKTMRDYAFSMDLDLKTPEGLTWLFEYYHKQVNDQL